MTLLHSLARRLGVAPPAETPRWVVLDVESSGLDPATDRLLAIAAIAVRTDGPRPRIALGDSFEVVLRHDAPLADKGNILLHGIGVGAQRRGVDPARALSDFLHYIGASPLIAFHAAFDRALLLRACDAAAVPRPANPWLDLEPLAAVLYPQARARSLDEWMAQLQIHCAVRHRPRPTRWPPRNCCSNCGRPHRPKWALAPVLRPRKNSRRGANGWARERRAGPPQASYSAVSACSCADRSSANIRANCSPGSGLLYRNPW